MPSIIGKPRKTKRPVRQASKATAKELYLAALRTGVTVAEACGAGGFTLRAGAAWRDPKDVRFDAEFATAHVEAYEMGTAVYEAEARRRAIEGWVEPVYQQGKKVGEVRKFDSSLLQMKLKARKPTEYRERMSVEASGPGGGPIEGRITIELVDARQSAEDDE